MMKAQPRPEVPRQAESESAPVRPIAALGVAGFASVATMRIADPLVPQVAQEFAVSAGDAAVIAIAFTLAYGVCQVLYGALGDRFGKYRIATLATAVSGLTTGLAGFAGSLDALALARLASGATAGAIIPLSLAFIGDHVPYRTRQTVLARFLSGTIFGIIAGQSLGGILGDLVGWRAAFFLLGGLFLAISALLALELRAGRIPRPVLAHTLSPASIALGYAHLFRRAWVRVVLATVFVEGFLFYGAFTFVGAWLRDRFGLDYASIGLLLGCMGLGGLVYALAVQTLVRTLGERGLALGGGIVLALGFVVVALSPLAGMAPGITLLGLGLYMLHNTLQTNATQMVPDMRGLAVSTFASVLFLGQAIGVWVCGLVVDRIGASVVFLAAGVLLMLLGAAFALLLRHRLPAG